MFTETVIPVGTPNPSLHLTRPSRSGCNPRLPRAGSLICVPKLFEQLTHFAGFDWAKDHHDAVILDRQGATVESMTFAHTAEGWVQWRERIKAYPALGVAIETNQGAAVEQLLQSPVTVYPMQPKAAERYPDGHVPSGPETDRVDGWCCGDAVRADRQ